MTGKPHEVRAVAGWVRESDAEAAIDALARPGSLCPNDRASIAACCDPEIQLSRDGQLRQWSSEPHAVHLDPLVFEAAARLAKLAGLRPEQFIEQLIKRHVRSLAP